MLDALSALTGRVARAVSRRFLKENTEPLAIRTFGPYVMIVRPGTPDQKVLERESFARDKYFPLLSDYVVRPTDVIVHIGAHVGGFAVAASQKAGAVFAVEAAEETYRILKANAALNGRDNIVASHVALSDSSGPVTLYRSDQGNWGNSLIRHGEYRGEESVASMPLEEYFARQAIDHCHLLVLNCEGSEFPILMSAPPKILQRVDRLIARYHCDLMPRYSPDTLPRHLEQHGFQCRLVHDERMPTLRGTIVANRHKM
jgi:FkbM family methyltransferase